MNLYHWYITGDYGVEWQIMAIAATEADARTMCINSTPFDNFAHLDAAGLVTQNTNYLNTCTLDTYPVGPGVIVFK